MLAIGGFSGLPGPWFDLCSGLSTEVISKEEARAVEAFEAMLDSAAQPAEASPSRRSSSSRNSTRSSRRSNAESAATGSAYRALKLLVGSMCGDPALLRCGLEKVQAEDGTVEWVAPYSKGRFVREGADCLIWNRRGEPNDTKSLSFYLVFGERSLLRNEPQYPTRYIWGMLHPPHTTQDTAAASPCNA